MTASATHQAAPAAGDRVPVWDLPTRIFHWSLAALVLVSWLTGEDEGASLAHRLSGEAIAGLLIFRVIWGVIGGEHARFAGFVKGPGAVAKHLHHLGRGQAEPTLGHNALGGLSVLLLLAAVAFVTVTGLFSAGEEGAGGPFAGRFGLNLAYLHEPAFRVLQAVVVLHLAGVVLTSLASRDNLVAAMVTGVKRRSREMSLPPARRASAIALLVAVALGAGTSAYLMSLPHPVSGGPGAQGEHREVGGGEDRD